MPKLPREEYVEQAYLFRTLGDRLPRNRPLQELLGEVKEELLASTQLRLAVDYLLSELRHSGLMSTAMRRLGHYFAPFQTYVLAEAENERGRFDMRLALPMLQNEATYRGEGATAAGLFLYQFEALCRNRLKYDPGLEAMAGDPWYDPLWREWILTVRRQIGIVDFADLLYVRSAYYHAQRAKRRFGSRHLGEEQEREEAAKTVLFGEKEGKIAYVNRRKEPLYLFAALQRHLGYPAVPHPTPADDTQERIPQLLRRMERLEARIKLLEEEQRHSGIDLSRFLGPGSSETPP